MKLNLTGLTGRLPAGDEGTAGQDSGCRLTPSAARARLLLSLEVGRARGQSAGLPAVVFEQKLINSADKSVLFGAAVADTLPQAVELEKIMVSTIPAATRAFDTPLLTLPSQKI